ncbi:MAG TPA: head GIN domain-containing protein [Puia sp.]|nr:head GIN domain-containing protein [Puia sp.]
MKKLFFLAFIVFIGLSSCRFMGKRIHGNGSIKTVERSVSAFSEVEASGDIKLFVSQGDLRPVKIEGDENILSYIEVTQEGDRIKIETKPGINLIPSGDLNVYVSSPNYKSIEVSGTSDIIGQTKITSSDELNLEASGAGDIQMEVDAPKITTGISGTGSIKLKGQAKDLDIDLSGAGHAYCYDLLTENTKVQISGAGSAQVYASVKLNADVSGAGNISYKGNASVSQDVSGAGSVNKVE